MCGHIIEVAVMVAKEDYLWIELAISIDHTEETHFFSSNYTCTCIPMACCGLASNWGGSSEDTGRNFLPGEK